MRARFTMTGCDFKIGTPKPGGAGHGGVPPALPRRTGWRGGFGGGRTIVLALLGALLIYGAYFWLIRRVVVHQGQVLVLLKKNGSRSLPGDQVIIPRPPDSKDAAAYAAWEKQYGDCNGIREQVYLEATYISFSPFDYEREVIDIGSKEVPSVTIPSDKVGLVIKKFGDPLPPGQVIADPTKNQRGPLQVVLQPGTRNNDYAKPYAHEDNH